MPALNRRTKKGRPNPYAERGLDQFALVSAELQAAREKLITQLGTSLSLVRFANVSGQTTWVPIIVPQTSSKAEMRALRRAASELVTGNEFSDNVGHPIVLSSGNQSDWETSDNSDTHILVESGTPNISKNTQVDCRGDEMFNQSSSEPGFTHVDSTKVYEKAKVYSMMAIIQGLLWLVQFIVFSTRSFADMARNVLGWHAVDMSIPAQSNFRGESATVDNHLKEMTPSSDPSSLTQVRTSMEEMPLPSLPIVASTTTGKPNKFPSAPSTPRASLEPTKPFETPVFLRPDSHEETYNLLDIKGKNPMPTTRAVGSSATRRSTETLSSKRRQHVPERLGQALTNIGLVFILSGLLMGYIYAIVGVVCWWYLLPRMRQEVGDKPYVRNHHHHHHQSSDEDGKIVNIDIKTRGRHVAIVHTNGNDNMLSYDHKKR